MSAGARRVVHRLVMKKFIDHDLIWPVTACKKPMTRFHVNEVTWYGKATCLRCKAKRKKGGKREPVLAAQ